MHVRSCSLIFDGASCVFQQQTRLDALFELTLESRRLPLVRLWHGFKLTAVVILRSDRTFATHLWRSTPAAAGDGTTLNAATKFLPLPGSETIADDVQVETVVDYVHADDD